MSPTTKPVTSSLKVAVTGIGEVFVGPGEAVEVMATVGATASIVVAEVAVAIPPVPSQVSPVVVVRSEPLIVVLKVLPSVGAATVVTTTKTTAVAPAGTLRQTVSSLVPIAVAAVKLAALPISVSPPSQVPEGALVSS